MNNFKSGIISFDASHHEALAISSLLRKPEDTLKLNQDVGLKAEHFASDIYQKAWRILYERASKGLSVDPSSWDDCANDLKPLDGFVTGLAMVCQLCADSDADGKFLESAEVVKQMANSRECYRKAEDLKTKIKTGDTVTGEQSNLERTLSKCEKVSTDQDARLSFSPDSVFYDSTTSRYLVELENHFRPYTRKAPVIQGLTRFYKNQGIDETEARATAKEELADTEIDQAVDWCGAIAGHKKGIIQKNGLSLLVTSEPKLLEPKEGSFPTIQKIFNQAFENKDAKTVFALWLANGFKAVREGKHQSAPMMTLAGEVNTGKSLLAWITKTILGGRVANPRISWSGSLPWNDDLVGAELLLLDDSVGSTDMRKRIEFGSRFKESIYASEVQVHQRNKTSMSLSPVWRVMVCCNRTPEALSILPPLDEDLVDKVSLLSVSRVELPVDTSTPEGKRELQEIIKKEIPAFMHELLKLKTPEHLVDSRAGVCAWRDQELVTLLEGLDESSRLEELLSIALKETVNVFNLIPGEEKEFSAEEIESKLGEPASPVREQCRSLLGRHTSVTGRLLGKLARSQSELVSKGSKPKNHQRWIIKRPLEG
jgi:hypothetical protein